VTTPAAIATQARTASPRTAALARGRQADSARRRQRVIAALDKAAADGTEISVSGIARAAAVDRSFLHRHRDLLNKIHALEAAPPLAGDATGPAVTRASLQADLLTAQERAVRLNARIQQLEKPCLKPWASRLDAPPASGEAPTWTIPASKPPACTSRTSACASRSKNATKNSAPTASSWPSSTPQRAGNRRTTGHFTTPVAYVTVSQISL
jgi:hypothetical protein